ncbi:MAG: DUF697 domain-containing protein [Leptolyngbya sp. SIO4C5]|nr:DUF697 domain-containing protein [Leptolyngbya sp. SIO4C5]
MKIKRPLLVGGLGLTASAWMLDVMQHSVFNQTTLLGAMALGSGLWWWQRQQQPQQLDLAPTEVDESAVNAAIAQIATAIDTLASEIETAPDASASATAAAQLDSLRSQHQALSQMLSRQTLRLGLLGSKGTGKTAIADALKAQWQSSQTVEINEVAGLMPEAGWSLATQVQLQAQDLLLFVTAHDLTESELKTLQPLAQNQRLLLIFNKQDQYPPMERAVVRQRLETRLQAIAPVAQLAAIATRPQPIKVRQHQADGGAEERWEAVEPDITALTIQLDACLTEQGRQLILETTMRQAQALRQSVQTLLNQIRRDRAQPLIEQMQWIAAAAAFANPLPTLDLLATGAINAQLVVDLGALYGQKFSLEQGKAAAGTLAGVMVKLGLVELSTQALSALLKSSTVTYVAGGFLQGVSAAYLTRLAGLSLIEFFEAHSLQPGTETPAWEKIGDTLKAVFQRTGQPAVLRGLVQQAIARLQPNSDSLTTDSSTDSLAATVKLSAS